MENSTAYKLGDSRIRHFDRRGSRRLTTATYYATLAILVIAYSVMEPACAVAQEGEGITAADTSCPQATLRSFIDACNEVHRLVRRDKYLDRSSAEYAQIGRRVIDCLDVSELPAFARDESAGEVAVCLKEILDRVELPPWNEIPDLEKIEGEGGFEKLSRWRIPGTRLTIARVDEGPQKHEYLFSTGTVERAVRYFKEIKSIEYLDRPDVTPDLHRWYLSVPGHPILARIVALLPERIQRGRICGLTAWKWPGLLVAGLVAVTLMTAAYRLHFRFRNRWRQTSVMKYWLTILFPVVAMLIPLIFAHIARRYLTVRGNPLYIIRFSCIAIALLAGVIVIFAPTGSLKALLRLHESIHRD